MCYNFIVRGEDMTRTSDSEFQSIIEDIDLNPNFRELDNELHHGISRYAHSYRVAKGVYKCTKKLKLNYEEATRAALLHDFYFNYQLEDKNKKECFVEHPEIACLNAMKYFNLSDMQQNMIKSHMFPTGNIVPKYKESICITLVDKIVALYEMQRYKIGLKLGIYLIFIINMITIQK